MKHNKIKILVGPPGSGKSNYARYWIRTEPNWVRVCRDDFRQMQFSADNLSHSEELLIVYMMNSCIQSLLSKNVNVLIDATHCKAEYINAYIRTFNHMAEIEFQLFEVPLNELKERCRQRYERTGKHIPDGVLETYYHQFKKLKENFDFSTRPRVTEERVLLQQGNELPKAIICDLDGTLALLNGRSPYDATHADKDLLNEPVADVLKNYKQQGYQVLLISGREDKFRKPTELFLDKHGILYDMLVMRPTGDSRKDSIVKKEIYKQHIQDRYYVTFILDDRNQVVDMWRKELSLPCFQVYYGDF